MCSSDLFPSHDMKDSNNRLSIFPHGIASFLRFFSVGFSVFPFRFPMQLDMLRLWHSNEVVKRIIRLVAVDMVDFPSFRDFAMLVNINSAMQHKTLSIHVVAAVKPVSSPIPPN